MLKKKPNNISATNIHLKKLDKTDHVFFDQILAKPDLFKLNPIT